MANETYRMEDGTVVKVANAVKSWKEEKRWNGSNMISCATGSQWAHEELHKSRKGRYWLESWSDYSGSTPHAEWIGKRQAVAWLLANGHEIPDDLKEAAAEVEE